MTTVAWTTVLPPGTPPDLGTGANPTAFGNVPEIWLVATCNGVTLPARRIPVRYAPGTGPTIADPAPWTVDAAITPINAAATGANLTFTYTATGLPAGLSINGSGQITGTPTAAGSGVVTVTPQDQHGRTVEYARTFSYAVDAAPVDPPDQQQTVVQVINDDIVIVSLAPLNPPLDASVIGNDISIEEAV